MDKLKECALIFKSLLDVEYKIILGRKNVLTEFILEFEERDFHHLVGLQKLEDRSYTKGARDKIFNDILNDKITYNMISSSMFFERIEEKNIIGIRERIDSFLNIIDILDANNTCVKYSPNRNPTSKISCEYILENKDFEKPIYIFLDKRDKNNYKYCRSFFPKYKIDYTFRQTKMALLYKEKKNIPLNESIIQINKLKQ